MGTLIELAAYEHKAALIGRSPGETARDSSLLCAALEAELRTYHADYLTLGIDLYNIEAEACGAEVDWGQGGACPELKRALCSLEALPAEFPSVDVEKDGRFPLILDAGLKAKALVGSQAKLRVGVSGPMTAAAKLAGMEDLLISLATAPEAAMRLLEFCASLSASWISLLRRHGLEAIMFDSMAGPPLVSPGMYKDFVLPLHSKLMRLLKDSGQEERPLVIGGDSAPVARHLCAAGANSLVCDFTACAADFAKTVSELSGLTVRRNADPKDLLKGKGEAVEAARRLKSELSLFARPVAGTGILPYDTPVENVLAFLEALRSP